MLWLWKKYGIFVVALYLFSSPALSYASDALYEKHLAKGISAIEASNYKDAAEEFSAALQEKTDDQTATLYLGIALSRSGDKGAVSYLKKALSKNPDDPRTNLELGIYYYNSAVYQEAADYLENTIRVAPNTEFSAKAQVYQNVIKKGREVKSWALNIAAGGQYDSNVVLNAEDSPLPQGISRKSDWRAIIFLKGKYNLTNRANTEGFIGYSFYQSLHSKLSDFNVSQHLLEVSAGYKVSSKVHLNGKYSFEYVFVGGDDYDSAHSLTPSVTFFEGSGFSSTIEYRYRKSHYINSELFSNNSERTGSNNLLGIVQTIPLHASASLRAGYYHDVDATEKEFWHYRGDKGKLDLQISFPQNISLFVAGEYYSKAYKGMDSLSGEKRKDRVSTLSVAATRVLSERYSLTVGQMYTRNKSNMDPFDYKRSITSLFLNARF
ncbi:MAG: hypothetical protein HZA17_13945 [Nitrospirae bacterium]|nr:hypothetical protein [Nitrospirota bacterium]